MEGLISKFTNSKHKTKKQKSKSKETNENNNFAGKILTEIFPVFFRQEKYIMKKSQYLWNSQQEKKKKQQNCSILKMLQIYFSKKTFNFIVILF